MSRFVVLFSAPLSVAQRFAKATPAEAQAGKKLWIDWARKLGPALVHPGQPLGNGMKITQGGAKRTNSPIVGMSIVEAGSADEALEMVRDHHHLRWAKDCEILLLEEMTIPEEQAA